MEIEELLHFVKQTNDLPITRGTIIDFIADNKDKWIYVLKALLLKNPQKFISRDYLLQKLNFMKNNPNEPASFLDFQGVLIYKILEDGY